MVSNLTQSELVLISSESTQYLGEYKAKIESEHRAQEAHQKELERQENMRLEEIRKEERRKEALALEAAKNKAFSDAMVHATFHFNIDRSTTIEGDALNKATYMMESIMLAKKMKASQTPHVLITDFSFTKKQAKVIETKGGGYLKIISLFNASEGGYGFAQMSDTIRNLLIEVTQNMLTIKPFAIANISSRYSSSIRIYAHNMEFEYYFENAIIGNFYTKDTRKNVRPLIDNYILLQERVGDDYKGCTITELFSNIETEMSKLAASARIPLSDLLPEHVFEKPYKIEIYDSNIYILKKNSPHVFGLEVRRSVNGVYIQMIQGSRHIYQTKYWYNRSSLRRSYQSRYEVSYNLEDIKDGVMKFLDIQTRAEAFQTFIRQYGAVIYDGKEYHIDKNESLINIIQDYDPELTKFKIDPSNKFAFGDNIYIRPLGNLYK